MLVAGVRVDGWYSAFRQFWEVDSDRIKDWSKWTLMKDEGSNTANYRYVMLGVSYLMSILTKRPGTMSTPVTTTDCQFIFVDGICAGKGC